MVVGGLWGDAEPEGGCNCVAGVMFWGGEANGCGEDVVPVGGIAAVDEGEVIVDALAKEGGGSEAV